MEIAVTILPETESRYEVARKCKKSVDAIDNAVRLDKLDFAVLSGSNKPIVKNEKYKAYLLDNGYKYPKNK